MRSEPPAVAGGLLCDMNQITPSVSSVVNNMRSEPPAVAGGLICDMTLPANQVHVWRVPLNHDPERTALSLDVLSPDERDRAARFHFDKDRNEFVQARAALRFILAKYLDVAPIDVEFSYGPQGKPALSNRHAESNVRFNLSRRWGLALIAVTRGREVGIDVELIRNDLPFFEIAEVSFSAAESEILHELPEGVRASGFYNCWTRKEAYVKARGEGFSFPLKEFDVSLTPGEPAMLRRVLNDFSSERNDALPAGGDLKEVDRWTFEEIPVGDGYVAALAFEGKNLSITCRDWLRGCCGIDLAGDESLRI
jgi:4'-phosphopantetheinyl transferase